LITKNGVATAKIALKLISFLNTKTTNTVEKSRYNLGSKKVKRVRFKEMLNRGFVVSCALSSCEISKKARNRNTLSKSPSNCIPSPGINNNSRGRQSKIKQGIFT
jgi:hypothetical protein